MLEMKDSGLIWIEKIPLGWTTDKLKYNFSFGKGLPITKDNLKDEGLPVVSYGQIHAKYNSGVNIDPSLLRYVENKYSTLFPLCEVKKYDFVFADTSEDYNGCGNCVYKRDDTLLFGGYHVVIAHSLFRKDMRYFAYLFQTDCWRRQIREKSSGVKVFSITQKNISNASIIVPPFEIQMKIADFLDSKCIEIDKLVTDIQTEIETLEEYKKSVIIETVTEGLNPDVQMKDSGIKYVGKIPSTWELHPVYYYFGERKVKNYALNEQNLLSLSYGKIIRKDINTNGGLLPASFNTYNVVEPGDIIIRPTDLQNDKRSLRTGLVTEHGIITSAYIDLMPKGDINSEYFHYLLHSFDVMKVFYNMGNVVRQGLNYSEFSKLLIFAPSKEEQDEIVKYLNDKCSVIEKTILLKKEQLATLEEYKKSIIYEYVTGKREVL